VCQAFGYRQASQKIFGSILSKGWLRHRSALGTPKLAPATKAHGLKTRVWGAVFMKYNTILVKVKQLVLKYVNSIQIKVAAGLHGSAYAEECTY
jgi:hypothetical protein